MPTARPFAFNSGAPIAGTEQIGQIAIGTTPQDYVGEYGGVRWWNGPDEDLGYVICYSVPTLDHPSPEGNIAGVGFFRSKLLTEGSFITIAEYVSNGQIFASGDDAKTWLNDNGYWTSWTTPPNGILRRSSGVFETYTGATITTFSSTTFTITGSTYLPVFDGQTKSFTHGGIEINDTVTIGVSGTPYFLVALTKNSTTFSQSGLWYTSESGFTINTAISTGDTFTVSVSVPVREYENSGTGNSAIEACSAYPSASTSKYSVLPWTNWGSDTYIFNDSQFTSPFTSAYIANVESGGSDILWKQTDSNGKVINQGTCASVTPTPSPTPTVTPTTPSANLLVYLDSGNPSSYPGAGSTWTDLQGGDDNATLFNSPTFSSSYQGILQFDDASFEYATIPDLGNLSEWTVEAWFRLTSPLTGKVTSIISNEFDLVNKLNFSIGTNNAPTNLNLSVGFFDGAWRTTTGVVPEVDVWYQVVGTYDGSVIRQYVNGVASGGTVNYVGTPQSGGEVRLMRRWDLTAIQSNLVDGDLAIVKIYNGAIGDAEVLSSYNSTYTRFLDITPTPTNTSTATPTPTVTPTTNIVTNNLILYYNPADVASYPGTGTEVFDLSTPQYNGTLANSPTHNFNDGGYFDFNGTNQYISIPHNSALKPTGGLTMEQWLYPDDWTGGGWPTNYWTALSNTQGGGWAHYLGADQFISYVRSNGTYQIVSGNTTGFSGWNHFVTTFDGQYTKLYINGTLIDSVDLGTSGNPIQYAVNNSLFIGAEAGSTTSPDGNYWDGKISITRLYNIALDASQVLQNYNYNLSQYTPISPTPTNTSTLTNTPTPSFTPTPSLPSPTSGFTATIQEVGSDVVWSGSGTFNLTDLTFTSTSNLTAGYNASQAIWAVGSNVAPGDSIDNYDGVTVFPASFGSAGGAGPTSYLGETFGIIPGGIGQTLLVPAGYVSGTFLSGSTTYGSQTISSMGLTTGTYVYSWGTGVNADTLTLIIG